MHNTEESTKREEERIAHAILNRRPSIPVKKFKKSETNPVVSEVLPVKEVVSNEHHHVEISEEKLLKIREDEREREEARKRAEEFDKKILAAKEAYKPKYWWEIDEDEGKKKETDDSDIDQLVTQNLEALETKEEKMRKWQEENRLEERRKEESRLRISDRRGEEEPKLNDREIKQKDDEERREKDLERQREQENIDQERRNQEIQDQKRRNQEKHQQELKDQELRDQETHRQKLKDQEMKDQERRDQERRNKEKHQQDRHLKVKSKNQESGGLSPRTTTSVNNPNELVFASLRSIENFENGEHERLEERHLIYVIKIASQEAILLSETLHDVENGEIKFARITECFIKILLKFLKVLHGASQKLLSSLTTIASEASAILAMKTTPEKYQNEIKNCLIMVIKINNSAHNQKTRLDISRDILFHIQRNLESVKTSLIEGESIAANLKSILRNTQELSFYTTEHTHFPRVLEFLKTTCRAVIEAQKSGDSESSLGKIEKAILLVTSLVNAI